MNKILRVFKNGFWYIIIMLAGYGYVEYAVPMIDNLLYSIIGGVVCAMALYIVIGALRSKLRF